MYTILLGIAAGLFNARDYLNDFPRSWRAPIIITIILFFTFVIIVA